MKYSGALLIRTLQNRIIPYTKKVSGANFNSKKPFGSSKFWTYYKDGVKTQETNNLTKLNNTLDEINISFTTAYQ
jgi:hypothetical protein